MITFREIREKQQVYPEVIPEDLRETIESWFDRRYVCDDELFVYFFQRVLLRDYGRYQQLLRIQPDISKYDWLVTSYREAKTWGKNTEDSASKKESTPGIKETSSTEHDGGTYKEQIVHDGKSTRTPDLHTTTDIKNTPLSGTVTEVDDAALAKTNPYSIEYENAKAGEIPDLVWNTAGQQSQSKAKTTIKPDGDTNETITQVGNTGTEGLKTDGTDTHTFTGKKSDTTTVVREGKDSEQSENSKAGAFQNFEIHTGRDGKITELLSEASSYIMNSSAWEWLSARLETCFMGVYDL